MFWLILAGINLGLVGYAAYGIRTAESEDEKAARWYLTFLSGIGLFLIDITASVFHWIANLHG